MKKNLRVLQINGFRGLFLTLFIMACLIAGFVAFPGLLAMHTWNFLALKTGSFATLNFIQGLLLWAIIAMGFFIFNKRKFIVSFNSKQELSEDEVNEVLSKIKSQTVQNEILLSQDENIEEIKSEKREN